MGAGERTVEQRRAGMSRYRELRKLSWRSTSR
jgi:hypothetical protein